jgi:hypothetical protein
LFDTPWSLVRGFQLWQNITVVVISWLDKGRLRLCKLTRGEQSDLLAHNLKGRPKSFSTIARSACCVENANDPFAGFANALYISLSFARVECGRHPLLQLQVN